MRSRNLAILTALLVAITCLPSTASAAQGVVRPALRPVTYFPLEAGNYWVYQKHGATETSSWRVEVLRDPASQMTGAGKVLAGYFPGPIRRVRVWPLDIVSEVGMQRGRDGLWYLLRAPVGVAWTIEVAAPPEPVTGLDCIDGSRLHVTSRSETVEVPAGKFTDVVRIEYEMRCADAGIMAEYFAPGIGLIRREEESFAGTVVSDLIETNAGGLRPLLQPYTTSLGLDRTMAVNDLMPSVDPKGLPELHGVLTVRNDTDRPVVLHFAGCRSAMIEVRNSAGEVVLTGHADDGGCCTCSAQLDVPVAHGAFALPFSLRLALDGNRPLPDGLYAVTVSFMTTDPPVLRPSATAQIEVRTVY